MFDLVNLLYNDFIDRMRNSLARTAAQIRTGHWRSAVYLKRIRMMAEDKPEFSPHDTVPRPAALPERQTPGSQSGGMGRKGPRASGYC
jgi:hypothetical protein